jgi:hypothetical protein
MFWRLMGGTVIMLAFGYAGENDLFGFAAGAWLGFVVGMAGWGFILFEIFMGEAGSTAKGSGVNRHVQSSFATMRLIVTVGWAIYPLGYFFGYLITHNVHDDILNLVYNLADFVNKIAFCLAIWSCAKSSTIGHEAWERFENVSQRSSSSPKLEAARKLISNYERVVVDATSQSPISQAQLQRVRADGAEHVEQVMREVARKLLGLPSEESCKSEVAQGCAAYFAQRTQSTGQQCPGREADMSAEAAAAFVGAVKEVASGAGGGKMQSLLP